MVLLVMMLYSGKSITLKLGFERFCYEYYGLNLTFVSEEDYDKIKQRENKNQEIIYTYDDIIVIDLSYLH